MFSSISSRIIAATIVLVVICSGSFLLLSMKEHEAIYKDTVIGHLEALSGNLAEDLVPILGDEDAPLELATKLLDLEVYEHVKYALVFDDKGQLVQRYLAPAFMREAHPGQKLPSFDLDDVSPGVQIIKGELVAYRPIGDLAYTLGYLLIVNEYQEPLGQSNMALVVSSLPIALSILVVMIALTVTLNWHLLSPLTQLARFTNSIDSSSNYHLRVECQGDDEVSNLGKNINAMLSRIEAQSDKNQEYTDALEQQQRALKKLANYDTLTNLPNRKFLMEALRIDLARSKRKQTNLMILFLDLDNFKGINDSLGHEAGDALLIRVSKLITKQLREGDVLARLGGDEFLVLLNDIEDQVVSLGIKVAERIISVLEDPIMLGEWEVQTGVSIGIADAISSDYDPETIIRNADMAMYQAKESGRNTYALFQQELQAQTMRKMVIANSLGKAIQDSEFCVNYHVKVGLNGRVNGLEALIRWPSSAHGMISPAEFIPVAEHSGKITAISRWVLQRVFSDSAEIFAITSEPLVVSINLSAYDIKDPNFIEFIRDQIVMHKVSASNFEFEITESAYLDNFDEAIEFIRQLREMGFSIALDDFGTGYSSLSYLTQLAIDTLKVDQKFVRVMEQSPRDRMIIEAIISLAHRLELNVCAEGVETAQQMDFLAEQGVHQLQGYYFSKPCPLDDMANCIMDLHRSRRLAIH